MSIVFEAKPVKTDERRYIVEQYTPNMGWWRSEIFRVSYHTLFFAKLRAHEVTFAGMRARIIDTRETAK